MQVNGGCTKETETEPIPRLLAGRGKFQNGHDVHHDMIIQNLL